jgi:hypothetical protein
MPTTIAYRPCGGTGHRKRAVAIERKLLHLLRENRLCIVCAQGIAKACQLWVVDLGLLRGLSTRSAPCLSDALC